jgi:chromosome segregation ATPase
LKQAVAEAVRAEKGSMSPGGGGFDMKQFEEILSKEKEERRNLKSQLKQEKKQYEALSDKLKDMELEMKRLERENSGKTKEIEILQNELSEMRNEKILAEQLDEEHSAKMKLYTQDLMATSAKYQQDIQNLISRNEKLTKEVELLKAKGAELERQATHGEQVKDALNRKIASKENDIVSLQSQVEKLTREKKQLESKGGVAAPRSAPVDTSIYENRIRELESIVESQKKMMEENRDDAFGILRSAKSLTPKNGRRVSHLTSRLEPQSYAPAAPTADWLEPLAIAEHVLTNIS